MDFEEYDKKVNQLSDHITKTINNYVDGHKDVFDLILPALELCTMTVTEMTIKSAHKEFGDEKISDLIDTAIKDQTQSMNERVIYLRKYQARLNGKD